MENNQPITLKNLLENYKEFILKTSSSFKWKTNTPLDDFLNSNHPNGLISLFCGRPGMGVSTLLINIALEVSKTNFVLFISADNCYDFSTKIDRIIKDKSSLKNTKIEQLQFLYYQHKENSPLDLKLIQEMYRLHKFSLLIIDNELYHQHYNESINELNTKLIKELKVEAVEKRFDVFISDTIDSDIEQEGFSDKKPDLGHLKLTKQSEYLFSQILCLYRPDYYGITEDENGKSIVGEKSLFFVKNDCGILKEASLQKGEFGSCLFTS